MLPFETPPCFSNGGFFNFLSKFNVCVRREKSGNYVEWDCDDDTCDATIALIFDIKKPLIACLETIQESGKSIIRQRAKLTGKTLRTRPFHFEVAHKDNESRRLTVIHPRNQLEVANFFYENAPLVTYYAGLSPFSLRKPASVAKDVFFDDKLHRKRLGERATLLEESHKEYQYIASYFSYEKYSNIYRFYESYGYHKAERSFAKLLKLDVSKCFDSIYTHSMPWALLGTASTKDHIAKSKETFGGRFDALLQNLNNGETNGIVIGPEFSRVFAELILQKADNELQSRLLQEGMKNKVHYEIFRYVDDFFVFHNSDAHASQIERHLASILREFKLNLNSQKTTVIEKPIITNLTIAKRRVQTLLSLRVEMNFEERKIVGTNDKTEIFVPKVNTNKLIIDFKTILRETKTTYKESLNYTFAAIEKAFKSMCSKFLRNRNDLKEQELDFEPDVQTLIDALMGLLEFSFFIYSSAQRVNFTIRLTRSICLVVDALNEMAVSDDLKNQFFKFAHDNIVRILKANRIEKYREVETLYLILALKKLGRNYRIEVSTLASYFGFEQNDAGDYIASSPLNMFSTTVLLLLLRNTKRYVRLKSGLEAHIVDRMSNKAAYAHVDAEFLMLYLDIVTCPYVSEATKLKLDRFFDLTGAERLSIQKSNGHWFTNWGTFDLTLELDKKRARQVY